MSRTREEKPVDVLVVGAGPAGSAAARAAAAAGASVILVDAKPVLGVPVRCAEFVPRLMAREVDIPDEAVAQAVDEMAVFCQADGETGAEADGERKERRELGRVRSPGFILHRERFDAHLAGLAVEAGAELVTGTRAAPAGAPALADSGANVVELTGREGTTRVRPKVTVAADGPFSVFNPTESARACLPAVQYTVRLARPALPMSRTEVHFARRFRSGYAWVFPKGELANVGIGCAPAGGRAELLPMLDAFVDGLRREGTLAGGRPERRTAGWIPVWGPPESAVGTLGGGGVLFAGDAAGFTDPVTGAGIWPAVATGRMAGKFAARALHERDVSLLEGYDEAWRDLLGGALERAAAARRRMEAEWDSRALPDLVTDVWPGL